MEKVNFWNKLHIYRDKIIVSCLLVLTFSISGIAQIKHKPINLANYDDRKLHYGFTLGLNSTRYNLIHSDFYVREDTVTSALAPRSVGFSLGFILNYKLADYFALRMLPTVSFYERKVAYKLNDGSKVNQITESTFIEIPLLAQYKSQRRKNLRFYLTAGLKAGIEAGAKKKEKKPSELRTQNFDLSFDYGIGMDVFYPFFKFSPEIRFSHGLLNMLNNDPNVYARSLNRVTSHTVSLFLHFE